MTSTCGWPTRLLRRPVELGLNAAVAVMDQARLPVRASVPQGLLQSISLNELLKAASLASVISLEKLMRRSQVLMQEKFEVLELYYVAAIYFLALTSPWNLVQVRLERHYSRGYAERPMETKSRGTLALPSAPVEPI